MTTWSEPSLFDGPGLDPVVDDPRLKSQIGRVWTVMLDGEWHTLGFIAAAAAAPEASVSARLRDLRKPWWGGHTVEEKRHTKFPGLHLYRLIPSELGLLDGKHMDREPDPPPTRKLRRVIIQIDPAEALARNHHDTRPIPLGVYGDPEPLASLLRDGKFTVTTDELDVPT